MIAHLLRFLLPWACAGCRTPLSSLEDDGFCGRCWLAIARIQGHICRTCGLPLPDGGSSCYGCRRRPPKIVVRAATVYQGILPPALHRFKYRGRKSLARSFGLLLRAAWERFPELQHIQGIVPVPLHPKNERIRGYNQAELLAHELSREISRPVISLLVRTRQTRSQIQLTRPYRQANMHNAFALHPLALKKQEVLRKGSFLLMDDVCTTASTLEACARALRGAGIRNVHALVLARDL